MTGVQTCALPIYSTEFAHVCRRAYVCRRATVAVLEDMVAPLVVGQDIEDIPAFNRQLQQRLHLHGRYGITMFAISAIDIALWDIRCKAVGKPLWQMAGGASDRCKAYCGGIDLNFPLEKLQRQTPGYLDAGFNGVQIKDGQPELADDLARAAALIRALNLKIEARRDVEPVIAHLDIGAFQHRVDLFDLTLEDGIVARHPVAVKLDDKTVLGQRGQRGGSGDRCRTCADVRQEPAFHGIALGLRDVERCEER